VELMARFDEEANINWAVKLEQAGAQVVYGVVGLKTHAKLALVIRRDDDQNLRFYAHLGTGNYHPNTTKFYTDFGLLTSNQELTAEVNEVFIHLTSLTKPRNLTHLWLAPFSLQKEIIRAIRNEGQIAREGRPARIIAKMNALLDESVIRALYAASADGVKIDLIVRGACALRPGVPGLSENIKVRSIIGRYLEHSRIYYFRNDLKHDVYLASADWMNRNLFRRIEVGFPVLDKALKKRVMNEGLNPYLKDNTNAWHLDVNGVYTLKKARSKQQSFNAQQHLMTTLGIPATPPEEPV
jgi:polyphosphate kinase